MENNTDQKTLTKQQDFADNKAKKKKKLQSQKKKNTKTIAIVLQKSFKR